MKKVEVDIKLHIVEDDKYLRIYNMPRRAERVQLDVRRSRWKILASIWLVGFRVFLDEDGWKDSKVDAVFAKIG